MREKGHCSYAIDDARGGRKIIEGARSMINEPARHVFPIVAGVLNSALLCPQSFDASRAFLARLYKNSIAALMA